MYRIRTFDEYRASYRRSITDPEGFWSDIASAFQWTRKWDRTLEWEFATPSVQWFIGGRLNITENCLDRQLASRGDKTALIWEPNDIDHPAQRISYRELHERVCRMANVLKKHGVRKGDRVCLYMPMVPSLAVS